MSQQPVAEKGPRSGRDITVSPTPNSEIRQDLEAIIARVPNETYAGLSADAVSALKANKDLPVNYGFIAQIKTTDFGSLTLARNSTPDGKFHSYTLETEPKGIEMETKGFEVNTRGEVIHHDGTDVKLAQKILAAAQNAVGLAATVRDLKDCSFHPGD
jgi:hypothetical protein